MLLPTSLLCSLANDVGYHYYYHLQSTVFLPASNSVISNLAFEGIIVRRPREKIIKMGVVRV